MSSTKANNPVLLPELVQDFKIESTTLQNDLTIHARSLGRRKQEIWRRRDILGHGGHGVVWLEHKVDGDNAADGVVECRAVKTVQTLGRGPVHYIRELEALAKFSQDKYSDLFVEFRGWYENASYIHLAMEYCPHGDLGRYLTRNGGSLKECEAKEIASQVLAGIVMMHRAGFANRDIKPSNILIKSKPPDDWWIKVCDFGLSKRAEDVFTTKTTVRGTPRFMPPELLGFFVNQDSIDIFMVDMWSLGETVFQILTGKPSFETTATVGKYVEGSLDFPVHILQNYHVSGKAVDFITSLMKPLPMGRMSSEVAIKHPWIREIGIGETTDRAANTDTVYESNRTRYHYPLSPHMVPGNQLTGISGQWTTSSGLSSQIPQFQEDREFQTFVSCRPMKEDQPQNRDAENTSGELLAVHPVLGDNNQTPCAPATISPRDSAIPIDIVSGSSSLAFAILPKPFMIIETACASHLQQKNTSSQKTQTFERLGLYHDMESQALVCMRCGFALTPGKDRVSRHLGERHRILLSERRNLNALVKSLQLLDPSNLPRLDDGSTPHPWLKLQAGAACKHCGLRSTSSVVLLKHLKNQHSQEVQGTSQRRNQWTDKHMVNNLTWQSWRKNDVRRSWIVAST